MTKKPPTNNAKKPQKTKINKQTKKPPNPK